MNYTINAEKLNYRKLNLKIRNLLAGPNNNVVCGSNNKSKNCNCSNDTNPSITIRNVLGQRYIGDGLEHKNSIKIYGTPGNNLGAFMDGPVIEVYGSGQDGVGNTMNSGKIIIHGDAGDILGYSMRGGEIYIKGDIGYRGGINMKSYSGRVPVIVVGGSTGDFLGEYMAGGIIIVLGLKGKKVLDIPFAGGKRLVGNYVGTGMHGGKIYIRGELGQCKIGKEVRKMKIDGEDRKILYKYINNYSNLFDVKDEDISNSKSSADNFFKLIPYTHRPYGKLYVY